MRYLIASAAACLVSGSLWAGNQPIWWTAPSTKIIQPGAVENNFAIVNSGQLKYVAYQAKAYLDANLPGGSGSAITNMVAAFQTQAQINNYTPVTVGQLKAVAKPFYDRLLLAGFFTRINLISHGYPSSWTDNYPWNSGVPVPVAENYALANLGQLKIVFSFDLADADADGLSDTYESSITGQSGGNGSWLSVLNGDGVHDTDGDGISDLAESQMGASWNPTVNNLNNTSMTETFVYDAAHRLVSVTGRSSQGYSSDANGNLYHTSQP